MALQGRHRYIVRCLDENFEIHNESITEELVKSAPVLEKINLFFRGDGPTKLIFYHRVNKEMNIKSSGAHELIVSDGSNIPLAQKAVFFFKTRTVAVPGEPLVRISNIYCAAFFCCLSTCVPLFLLSFF
jgi:hypothetical protein